MKTLAKLLIGATMVTFVGGMAMAAEDMELVRVDHGRTSTFMYRPTQKETTIGFYSSGRGIGRPSAERPADLHLKRHEMPNGVPHYYYVREKE